MNTTADKLNRLTETKNAIKTAIAEKGGAVNDAMPFREYANAIMGIPQEGGSGGSGIIDVTELPISNIDENAVYRVTESYKPTVDDLILVMPDEETGETLVQQSLLETYGEVLKLYVVDELPADMKVTDLENGEEFYIYLLRTDGIGYINALQFGAVLPIGVLIIGEEDFDKGITDNVYAETEVGVYSTFESYEQIIRWFVRENGEWKEITGYFYETFLNGTANVSSLSGVYTEGADIVVTQNGTTVNVKELILKDKAIASVVVNTPSVTELILGAAEDGERIQITDDYFRRQDGSYVSKIRAGAFYDIFCDDINIPNEVDTIGESAFRNIYASSISLPRDIAVIPRYAFYAAQIETFELPEQVKEIREYAFSGSRCVSRLPDSVERIEDYAFRGAYGFRELSLPKSLVYMGGWAFMSIYDLEAVTFNSKPEIHYGRNIFDSCPNLTTINVPWSEGEVAGAPFGATNATINYNYTGG